MRFIIAKEASDLRSLADKLVDKRSSNAAAVLERVKELNPHVDAKRVKAGTVLILPDEPGIKSGDKDSQKLGGRDLRAFGTATLAGFEAAAARARGAAEQAGADRSETTALLKTAAVKRQLHSDAALKQQVDEAAAATDAEQKSLKEAAGKIETLAKSFADELAAMKKLLG